MIKRVGSKSASKTTAGTKRPASKSIIKASRKRQKSSMASWLGVGIDSMPEAVQEQEPEPEPEVPWTVDPDQVFRFMDLPGELRNRIYEYAVDISYRAFPHTYTKPKKRSKRLKANRTLEEKDRRPPLQPLPYIGLTQVCTQIRTEFRPLWLSTHRFPLYVVNDYLRVFFPSTLRKPPATKEVKKRIAATIDPCGTLRIFVNREGLMDTDIRSLLKHSLRFPGFKIELFSPHPDIAKPETIASISALLNNPSPLWNKYLKRNIITQVRLRHESSMLDEDLHIVVKEEYAERWMKDTKWPRRAGAGYLKSLGLDGFGWGVGFGVDYS